METLRRLVPDEPLPPYTFVPGRAPHPESDPAGHSFGRARPPVPTMSPERWATNRHYLRGIDLFNAGFFWESHVEWEALWLAAGRKGPVADCLRGLIHLAAAGVKHLAGNARGTQSHAARAAELWRGVAVDEQGRFLGLRLASLIEASEAIRQHGWPDQPLLLLPTALSGPAEASAALP